MFLVNGHLLKGNVVFLTAIISWREMSRKQLRQMIETSVNEFRISPCGVISRVKTNVA